MTRLLAVLLLPLLLAASARTTNFVVEAPTQQYAQAVAEQAERSRADQARAWLGYALPDWPRPCPIAVTITSSGSGGATSFAFGRQSVIGMSMRVEGRSDKILSAVIPHEVTHTVLATYFGGPLPRWVDEGAAVLAEDAEEQARQAERCREVLRTPGRAIPLRRLLTMAEYPQDVLPMYAQGSSLVRYLVRLRDRPTLIGAITYAQSRGWDEAIRATYGPHVAGMDSVSALERMWRDDLSRPRTIGPDASAITKTKDGPAVVPATVTPQTPTTDATTRDLAAALRAIAETQRVQAETVRDHERRLRAVEERLGLAPVPWSSPPARPSPVSPSRPSPVYEQPVPWSPSPSCPLPGS